MRRKSFIPLVIFVFIANPIQYNLIGQETDLSKGLVAYFPFSGNADDKSGKGNHLENKGATLVKDRFDDVDKAFSFNGNNSIRNRNFKISHDSSWSVSFWMLDKSTKDSKGITIISTTPAKAVFPALVVRENNGELEFGFFSGNTFFNTGENEKLTKQFWKDNKWHLITIVSSEEKGTFFYFDAMEIGHFNSAIIPSKGLFIGMRPDDPFDSPFKGFIDDIMIYDRPLNKSEVKEIKNGKKPVPFYNGPIWYVSKGGSDDFGNGSNNLPFSTIQKAIDQCQSEHEIKVDKGIYYEELDFKLKNIKLLSIHGANSTIIHGSGEKAVISFLRGESEQTVLDGFTIENGKGGINIQQSSPLIKNCVLRNNKAGWGGGGIYLKYSSSIIFNCHFYENTAHHGGAVFFERNRGAAIVKCIIENNGGVEGKATQSLYGTATILNCTIINNYWDRGFGASSDQGSVNGGYLILNSIIYDKEYNKALLWAGGMTIVNSYLSSNEHKIKVQHNIYNSGLEIINKKALLNLPKDSKLIGGGTFDTSYFENFNRKLFKYLHDTPKEYPNPINSNPDVGAIEYDLGQPIGLYILNQPESKIVTEGMAVTFDINVNVSGNIKYMWYKDDNLIPDLTRASFYIETATTSDEGVYKIIVQNENEQISSDEFFLKVNERDDSDIDSDFDGLTDLEEELIGTSPNLIDTDGDGFKDGYEVNLNSDPLSSDDTPEGRLNLYNAVEILFHTDKGSKYQLQYSTDLESWLNYGDIINGIDDSYSTFVSTREYESVFWRLKVVERN